MPDPNLTLITASADGAVAGIEAATRDIAQVPLLQHLADVMPAADLMLGSVMLVIAGNTYTTIGYGNFILPDGWKMLAPIIAMSGLFTFGWTGSVLVDLVARCQKIKDAAAATGK